MTQYANPLIALAAAAADWQIRDLSPQVEWATRRALLDWFATTLPGCMEPPASMLVAALSDETSPGQAICYVDGTSRSARQAALINAVASHIVEFDDIFKDGGYHPGSPTIAAALAVAQHRQVSLERLHRAIVAGYEVGCRVSLAIQPSHYAFWHTTATVGTIGAAVASAALLGCDASGIGHAIALASSFAGGHQQNLTDEGMAKAMHPGHAADAGLLAAKAARAGMTGSLASLAGAKGFAAATSASSGNWEMALDGLGDWTPITRMTIKAHGCCGHIFPAIDAIKALQNDPGFTPEDVVRIHVDGYAATSQMCNRPEAQSAQDARFSIQYCLAAQIVLGAVRLEAFGAAALSDPRIRQLMPRISVSEDAELAAAYPSQRMAKIALTLRDGRVVTHFQKTRKGDPEDPLTDDELVAKFLELGGVAADLRDLHALRTTILSSDRLPGLIAVRPR